jgi:hypothetical protein
MKKLILILIILFSFSLVYGQTASDISNKLIPLIKSELSEVSTKIDAIIARKTETIVESKDCSNGQVLRRIQTLDREGKKLGEKKIEWTYYSSGPVDIITITQLDQNDRETSTKKIKHFLDGRQPQGIK